MSIKYMTMVGARIVIVFSCLALAYPALAQQAVSTDKYSISLGSRKEIDVKAIWLMTSSSSSLRNANSIYAVIRTRESTGSLEPRSFTDTLRMDKGLRGGYISHQERMAAGGIHASVTAFNRSRCTTYSVLLSVSPSPDKVDSVMMSPGNAEFCRNDNAEARMLRPVLTRPFIGRSPGGDVYVSEWATDLLDSPLLQSLKYVGLTEWNGQVYHTVEWAYETAANLPERSAIYTTRAYVGLDMIVHRLTTTNDKRTYRIDTWLDTLSLDTLFVESDFVWLEPQGVTVAPLRPRPKREGKPSLAGSQYPRFSSSGKLLDGVEVTAEEIIQRNRGTLFWFWNTGCATCIRKFPHLEQLYREFKSRGIEVVAVNVFESVGQIADSRRYRVHNESIMPIVFVKGDWSDWTSKNSLCLVDARGKITYAGSANKVALRREFERLALPPDL